MNWMAAGAVALMGLTACGHKEEKTVNVEKPEMSDESLDRLQAATADEKAELETYLEEDSVAQTAPVAETAETPAPAKQAQKGDGYTTTASGLKYKVLKQGKGRSPKATDIVLVNYEGKLTDGTIFDSSYQRGEPISFPLNRVIAGWTEGLQLMKEGSTYEFYIPYQLAYGEMGGGPIPPKADLIFKVDLIEVK